MNGNGVTKFVSGIRPEPFHIIISKERAHVHTHYHYTRTYTVPFSTIFIYDMWYLYIVPHTNIGHLQNRLQNRNGTVFVINESFLFDCTEAHTAQPNELINQKQQKS